MLPILFKDADILFSQLVDGCVFRELRKLDRISWSCLLRIVTVHRFKVGIGEAFSRCGPEVGIELEQFVQ